MYDLVVEYLSGIQEALGSRPPTPQPLSKKTKTPPPSKPKEFSLIVETALEEGITFH